MPALLRRDRATGRPLTHRHRGQALIEMAMVSILLLTLVVGIIDFGIYFYRYVQAANCVRETARRAAVRDPNALSASEDRFCFDAAANGALAIAPGGWVDLASGEPVTASVSTTHTWIAISYLIPAVGSTVGITASSTMRMEGERAT